MCHDGMLDSIQFPSAETHSWYFRFIWIDRLMLRLTWCQWYLSFCFCYDLVVFRTNDYWWLGTILSRECYFYFNSTKIWSTACSIILVHFAHFLCVPTHFSLNSVSIKPLIGFCLANLRARFFLIFPLTSIFLLLLYSHRNCKFSVFTFVLI